MIKKQWKWNLVVMVKWEQASRRPNEGKRWTFNLLVWIFALGGSGMSYSKGGNCNASITDCTSVDSQN